MKIENKRFVTCPVCKNGTWVVEHLFEAHFNKRECTWSCGSCSARFNFCVTDGVFAMSEAKRDSSRCLVLLCHAHDPKTLIVVKGYLHGNDDYKTEAGHKRYYYEEHTCPTNFLGVMKISREGDQDYHGIFEYVRHVDMVEAENLTGLCNWEDGFTESLDKVFPELADENYQPKG